MKPVPEYNCLGGSGVWAKGGWNTGGRVLGFAIFCSSIFKFLRACSWLGLILNISLYERWSPFICLVKVWPYFTHWFFWFSKWKIPDSGFDPKWAQICPNLVFFSSAAILSYSGIKVMTLCVFPKYLEPPTAF